MKREPTNIDVGEGEVAVAAQEIVEPPKTASRVGAAVSSGVKMAVDNIGSREDIPDSFMLDLSQKFGNARWSDVHKGRIIVDSLEARIEAGSMDLIYLDGYLATIPGVKVVKSSYGGFSNVAFELRGKKYEIFGRRETVSNYEFGSSKDRVFMANLASLRDVLPPNPRVLYLGANADPTARKVFGQSVVAVDISGDHLRPGDVKADAARLPFESDSFDLVVMKDSANFNLDPRVKNELIRVLDYGALIFNTMTMEHNSMDIRYAASEDGRTSSEMASEFRDLYTDGGNFVNVEGVDIDGLEQSSLLRKWHIKKMTIPNSKNFNQL